jgi:hypothetical protein
MNHKVAEAWHHAIFVGLCITSLLLVVYGFEDAKPIIGGFGATAGVLLAHLQRNYLPLWRSPTTKGGRVAAILITVSTLVLAHFVLIKFVYPAISPTISIFISYFVTLYVITVHSLHKK